MQVLWEEPRSTSEPSVLSTFATSAVGAISGHFADYGISRDFIEQVRGKVKEGTSALFLLVGQVTTDRVVEAFKAAPKFEIIASNLSKEQEERLKEAFAH